MTVRRPGGTRPASTPPAAESARLAALRLLGRRDHTADELGHKLKDRGYAASDVEDTIDQLRIEGLVNDRRAALAHARTASQVKGRGPLRIRRELQARGVDAEIISEATDTITDESVREAIGRHLTRRRVPQPVPVDQRSRLFQQLLRRGFPARLIGEALRFTPEGRDDS